MARLLLKLGATCSQADSKGCTAFHRYVENGNMELLDVLWDADKTGVKTAINHLFFGGYRWNPDTIAPMHSAIEHGSPILVLKLLNAGALTQIDFETWIKAAKVSPTMADRLFGFEQNQLKYKESTEQPLIAAVRFGDPNMALKLLEHGASPNALTTESEKMLINEHMRRYTEGTAVLDMVQESIVHLSKYNGENCNTSKPRENLGMDTYLENFKPGTYSHWVISENIEQNRISYEDQMRSYWEEMGKAANMKGVAEKKEAISEAIRGLRMLENELRNRGGKTFKELYPDIETRDNRNRRSRYNSPASSPKQFSYAVTFLGENSMTETTRDGYIDL